ncbi:DUF4129 domain-containing protein [Acrocarpospora catenulata]|uniref:DUF4129 domain-containing protein n=1 Tax=Acrocarpospora catenulata TaxID=2836182 RepID=UPI0027E020EF|nr:DUF4129 domain-containing protein [Acrocarpospora catenulata]
MIVFSDVPVEIGREAARDAAIRELADSIYPKESWLDRLSDRFWSWLNDLINSAAGLDGGWLALAVLGLILLALALLLLRAARKATRAAGEAGALYGERRASAAEHRAAAERHAAAGEWAPAIRERLRAIARDLEDRAVVEPLPGRTAAEFGAEAGAALPEFGGALAAAARLFDDVTYGDLPGTADGYATLAALDERLRTARPVPVVS